MKIYIHLLLLFSLVTTFSCERNVTLTSNGRFIASEHLQKINGQEGLVKSVQEFLGEEQNLHNKDLWGAGAFSSNIDPEYIPENNPKFPLPYYLVPEEDAHFLSAKSLDPRVADQLILTISGRKHFKLFVHPESEEHYNFLKASYNYVGPDKTEFLASPTSSYRSLIVWNRNNIQRKAFIAKVSLDKNVIGSIDRLVSVNEVERSVANQKAFDKIGEKKLTEMNLKIFPESAGLTINKAHANSPEKLGGQLIREIPDELYNGDKKWLSLSAMMSPNKKPKPLIMDIIEKSGLSSYDFFKTFMIDSYLNMYEEVSLINGINFEPHSQNLVFETTHDLRPTGKWVIRDFGGIWPDVLAMAKNNGPVEIYMEAASASKFKLQGGRANYISSYVFFYKRQVFDMMCTEVAKHDPSLTPEKILSLKSNIDEKYTKLINKHLGLKLKNAPNMTDYKNIEKMILEQSELDNSVAKKSVEDNDNLKFLMESKKAQDEWIELAPKKGKSEYFLTNHGVYEISKGKIVGLALFNHDELIDYQNNNQMLPSLSYSVPTIRTEKTGCMGMILNFFRGTK